jgi:ubiquinone/menaquinone biosynthesis C-methylase UbiE
MKLTIVALERLLHARGAALKEMWRVLRSGGMLVVAV